MTSADAAARTSVAPSLIPLRALADHVQEVLKAIDRAGEANAEIRKQIAAESQGRNALVTIHCSLSNQNLMLRDALDLTDARAEVHCESSRKLQSKKAAKKQLEEELAKRAENFDAKQKHLTSRMAALNASREERIAAVRKEVAAHFLAQAAELDAQMDQMREDCDRVQKEMVQAEGMHQSKRRKLLLLAQEEFDKKKEEINKKCQRVENDTAKMEPLHQGNVAALRRQAEKELKNLENQLQDLTDESKRLQNAIDLIPKADRSRKESNADKSPNSPENSEDFIEQQSKPQSGSPLVGYRAISSKKPKPNDALSFYRSLTSDRK